MTDYDNEPSRLIAAFNLGYVAFQQRMHYSKNPFNDFDWQRQDAWDSGWRTGFEEHPELFDHANESFRKC